MTLVYLLFILHLLKLPKFKVIETKLKFLPPVQILIGSMAAKLQQKICCKMTRKLSVHCKHLKDCLIGRKQKLELPFYDFTRFYNTSGIYFYLYKLWLYLIYYNIDKMEFKVHWGHINTTTNNMRLFYVCIYNIYLPILKIMHF